MTSSPACWSAFGEIIAREYSDLSLMAVHRLTVDAWAVQHPGNGSRAAVQSVGLHLARLMVQLEQGLSGDAANRAMLSFAKRKSSLPALPPRSKYRMTVADVVHSTGNSHHQAAVRRWARCVWEDWSDQHDFIRQWALGSG